MVDTEQEREAALRRDATLEAVAFAAQRFLEAPAWEEVVEEVLRRLGEAASVSRVYLVQNSPRPDGRMAATRLFGWTAPEIAPEVPRAPEAESYEGFKRWVSVLGRGELIHGKIEAFPDSEREQLRRQGIRSILVAPIFVDAQWWGYVGFDDCRTDRRWTQIEIDALRAAVGTLGGTIHRRRSEEHLLEAEWRYRTLIEQIPAVTYIDAYPGAGAQTWPTIYMSPQVETLLGYSPAEWVENPRLWPSLLHPDDREEALAADARHYASGEPLAQEYRMMARDGRVVWVRDEAVIVRGQDGTPRFAQGFLSDITERKLAEHRLLEAEERFRSIVEHTPAITYREAAGDSYEASSSIAYVSPQIERILGYPTERWSSEPGFWSTILHPDDRDRVIQESNRVSEASEPYSQEYRMIAADGRVMWFHDEALLLRDEAGRPAVWQGVMIDITERKLAEERFREAERMYRVLVEHLPAVVYRESVDADPTRLYISPQVETMFGYTPEEWVGTPSFWEDHIHPDERERVIAEEAAGNVAGLPYVGEYRLRKKDGDYAWVHDEATLVKEASGEPFWQGFILDITERKTAEGQLERALDMEREASQSLRALDEMKNTFLQAVSHDLRTPLAAILGLAVTLERADIELDAGEARDLARRIASNSRKLDRMVTDLLDLDRLARGIVEPKLHPTDIGALVRRVVSDFDLTDRGLVSIEAAPATVSVDGAKVERIVENLLANTARHTPAGTRVWVRVERTHGGVTISVEDEGPGVRPELRDAVFEPFRQGPGPAPSPGVGVGLTLVARFAELMGGRAWVEDREGGGAAFRVFLPEDGKPGTG